MAPDPPRRALAWLFVLAAALAACVVDLSDTHRGHHADSLIPVLTSLYHWEPFFWGSDRNGQLIPLLAAPCTHPFANLLVQFGLSVLAGVAALGVLARLVAPACWPAVAAVAWALFLFGYSEYVRFNMFNPCQPYTVSLLCAGGGLWLVGRGRWPLAVVPFVLAGWVNVGLALCLGPWLLFGWLSGGRDGPGLRRTDCLRGLLLLMIGTAAGLVFQRLCDCPRVPSSFLPPNRWEEGWGGVWRDLSKHFGVPLKVAAGLLAIGAAWFVLPATRAVAGRQMRVSLAAAGALVVGGLFSGTMEWVADNGYTSRYLFPSLLLINVTAAAAVLDPLVARLSGLWRGRVGVSGAAAVAVLPLTVYGWPSVREARAAVEEIGWSRASVSQIADRGCTHVCGDYWEVWPLVFRTNLALTERGEGRVVWGIAPRSEPSRTKWSAVPSAQVRLGWLVPAGRTEPSPETGTLWRTAFPGLRLAERGPTLWLYTGANSHAVATTSLARPAPRPPQSPPFRSAGHAALNSLPQSRSRARNRSPRA